MLTKEIKELEEQIKYHDERYYGDSDPEISDHEYDALVVKLRNLLSEAPPVTSVLSLPGSSSSSSGLERVKHIRPMISLRTEIDTSEDPINKFLSRVFKDHPGTPIIAEYKYDGLALSLRYHDGKITDAILRGDGEYGESVIENVMYVQNILQEIDRTDVDEIRGELILPRLCLEYINEMRVAAGEKPYVNCRNAVSGIVRSKSTHPKALESLVFMPYSCFGDSALWKQSECLDWLKGRYRLHSECDNIAYMTDVLYAEYESMRNHRQLQAFDVDGVVFKVDDLSVQEKMGSSGREPRWAFAHKFEPEKALTVLEGIDVQVGQSGRITPVARIKPVMVGGVVVSNVTLSNLFQVRSKKVRIGDTIQVQRAGDVIPEIVGVDSSNVRRGYVPNFRMPTECPVCSGEVVRNKGAANHNCVNPDCSAQVAGKFVRLARREVLDIEGLGPAVAEVLQASGIVKTSQLLQCDEIALRAAGLKRAESIKLAKEFTRILKTPISMKRLIQALNIPTIGDSVSEILSNVFTTKEAFLEATIDEIIDSPGLTTLNIKNLIWYLDNNPNSDMVDTFDLFTVAEKEKVVEGALTGKTVVITGSHPEMTGANIEDLIKRNGGKVGSGVSKATSLLIHGDGAGSKLAKAISLGTPRMPISEFLSIYN